MGNCRGSKSPTARSQIAWPAATRVLISPAMRRISEPTRPLAIPETRLPAVEAGPLAMAETEARTVSVMPPTMTQGPAVSAPRAGDDGERGAAREHAARGVVELLHGQRLRLRAAERRVLEERRRRGRRAVGRARPLAREIGLGLGQIGGGERATRDVFQHRADAAQDLV